MLHIRTAFPDIHVTVEDFLVEGDKLVNRVTYRGTHGRERTDPTWVQIAPTGRVVSWMAIAINRFEGGKSLAGWDLMDNAAIWRQLGPIPSPDSAA